MLNSKGQTLIELIVVILVSIIVIGGLVFAIISSLRNAQFAKNQAQATKLAQEGIEFVRAGRDRNQCIINLEDDVDYSWNGNGSECPGSLAIWDYRITGNRSFNALRAFGVVATQDLSSKCEDPTTGSKCYFTVSSGGSLKMIGYSLDSFPEDQAEGIPSESPVFRRVVILSDDSTTFNSQKTVTVIVRWTDFSGPHESKLTTILRRID